MATRPKNSAEAGDAAGWVADIERQAAGGSLWDGTPPVAEQLGDHFTRLGLTDTTTQELERRANRVRSGEAIGEDWATVRQRLADELAD